ncbi:hypothetical protein C0J52_08297 [Blattella germanica]|nr:hypothetical protein C0J52_08297 [Blattella germanica]
MNLKGNVHMQCKSSLQMAIVNLYNYLKKEAEAENVCISKSKHCVKISIMVVVSIEDLPESIFIALHFINKHEI